MKIIKYYKSNGYWIDTYGYDYSKLKVGDKVVCINQSIISLASMAQFGEVYEIKEIQSEGLFLTWKNDGKPYKVTINGIERTYLGTIKFDRKYKYTHTTLIQEHSDWIQRFVLETDYKAFMRKNKLERIIK